MQVRDLPQLFPVTFPSTSGPFSGHSRSRRRREWAFFRIGAVELFTPFPPLVTEEAIQGYPMLKMLD